MKNGRMKIKMPSFPDDTLEKAILVNALNSARLRTILLHDVSYDAAWVNGVTIQQTIIADKVLRYAARYQRDDLLRLAQGVSE